VLDDSVFGVKFSNNPKVNVPSHAAPLVWIWQGTTKPSNAVAESAQTKKLAGAKHKISVKAPKNSLFCTRIFWVESY
jgi:hypothetical protein